MKELEPKLIMAAQLIGSAGTTITAYVDDYIGASTFVIMFLVSLYVKLVRFRQETRHAEDEHQLKIKKLKQQDEN
ncbi:hypothetical protein [Haliscomenobacter hydrossis]|nr:hypothetical protein [Haliscomenobacter hydrossis]